MIQLHRADELREYGLCMVDIQATYTIEFPEDFDAYLQILSPRSRQKIKRTVRRFESTAEAPVRVVAFRNPTDMNNLHLELTRVWERSWHGRVANQQVPPVAALTTLASQGWVRAYVLFVGDQSVASVLGFQYKHTFYYESPAYDQDWQDRSPGIVLLYHTLKNLFETDPPERFDFGAGYGQYKQVFGTREEFRGSIQIGITGRGKLITYLQSYLRVLFKSSRAAFQWTSIPRLIKRRIREGG
ncbi:MAG: GNAT family N-acetyltransferase [Pirellulaceae bacterium]